MADAALYRGKKAGRDRVETADKNPEPPGSVEREEGEPTV